MSISRHRQFASPPASAPQEKDSSATNYIRFARRSTATEGIAVSFSNPPRNAGLVRRLHQQDTPPPFAVLTPGGETVRLSSQSVIDEIKLASASRRMAAPRDQPKPPLAAL